MVHYIFNSGAMTIIEPGSSVQLLIALLIVQTNMLMVLKKGPFVDAADDWLAFLTSGQMFLTLLGGLALMSADSSETYESNLMGYAMIVINSCGFVALFLSLVMLHPRCRTRLGGGNRNSTKISPEEDQSDGQQVRAWGGPAKI